MYPKSYFWSSSQDSRSALAHWLSCALLFLFPIAGNSVRSWTGIIFFSLVIVGILFTNWRKPHLTVPERILIFLLSSVFFLWIASGVANGWSEFQSKGIGVQIRALLFLPLYLAVKHNPKSFEWLVHGCIAASIVLFSQCIYDIHFLGKDRGYGVYDSPGLVASQSVIFLFCMASHYSRHRITGSKKQVLLIIGAIAALGALTLSGSRSTYLTVAVLSFVLPFLMLKMRTALFVLASIIVFLATTYVSNDIVQRQVQKGISELETYIKDTDKLKTVHGSVGSRLEMWRAALLISKDNPVLGVGWRNFSNAAQTYSQKEMVNPSSIKHPHPHNSYLEFLVTAGFPGLIAFVAVLLYPLFIASRFQKQKPAPAHLLKAFSLMFVINSVNEGGGFIYGNSLSFFLVFLAVLFSETTRQSSFNSPRFARQEP